ncbi:MAG: hypothetical protein WD490_07330, partial [Opitutales bacterium]
LAYWDDGSEKIVQQNHPNLVDMFFNRELDREGAIALRAMLPHLDVIEVKPIGGILMPADLIDGVNTGKNRMHAWLQMTNLGMWLPGVVNTDAHRNFHGSGGLRNFIFSPEDDPAKVELVNLMDSLRKGRVVMSNGPFMEVIMQARSDGKNCIPGDTIVASGGKAELRVRVQCPNWLDIDRVQVLVNGRQPKDLNFTRDSHPKWFSDEVVKFDRSIPLNLEEDAHIIVVAIGERTTLGPVMGEVQRAINPTAVSNPIFVDVDGEGFKPNGDRLDL